MESQTSESNFDDLEIVTHPKNLLIRWALEHNVAYSALNHLFPIIRRYSPSSDLLADARTFCGTERPTGKIVSMGKGIFLILV